MEQDTAIVKTTQWENTARDVNLTTMEMLRKTLIVLFLFLESFN